MIMKTVIGSLSSTRGSASGVAALLGVVFLFACGAAMANQTTDYEYDALGRLVKVTRDDGGQIDYSYDASGNRETVVTVAGSNPPGSNQQQDAVIVVIITTYLLL